MLCRPRLQPWKEVAVRGSPGKGDTRDHIPKPAPSGAATILAHGFSRGKKWQFGEALERATQTSRPDVSFVVFNLMSFQEGNKLLLE